MMKTKTNTRANQSMAGYLGSDVTLLGKTFFLPPVIRAAGHVHNPEMNRSAGTMSPVS